MKGILGRKEGMTQVFSKDGILTPVTVVSVDSNIVVQIKTKNVDGYDAVQLGFMNKREKLSNKPEKGHYKKSNTSPKRFLKEIRNINVSEYSLGQEIKADLFEVGEVVDVTGTSKGKGFQGVIKRYNFSRGPMSHGSTFHRGVGSLGSVKLKRVIKGKKMPGHMGFEKTTIQNLEVIATDLENNIILIKGSIPGPKGSLVIIKTAVKKPNVKFEREELISFEQIEIIEPEVKEELIVKEESEVIEKEIKEEKVEESKKDDETKEPVEQEQEDKTSEEEPEATE